jgi:hypothetical protein
MPLSVSRSWEAVSVRLSGLSRRGSSTPCVGSHSLSWCRRRVQRTTCRSVLYAFSAAPGGGYGVHPRLDALAGHLGHVDLPPARQDVAPEGRAVALYRLGAEPPLLVGHVLFGGLIQVHSGLQSSAFRGTNPRASCALFAACRSGIFSPHGRGGRGGEHGLGRSHAHATIH